MIYFISKQATIRLACVVYLVNSVMVLLLNHGQMSTVVTTMYVVVMAITMEMWRPESQNRDEFTRNRAVRSMLHVFHECMLTNSWTKQSELFTYQHTLGILSALRNTNIYRYHRVPERQFPCSFHREFQPGASSKVTEEPNPAFKISW